MTARIHYYYGIITLSFLLSSANAMGNDNHVQQNKDIQLLQACSLCPPNVEHIRQLLAAHANPNAVGQLGQTPLILLALLITEDHDPSQEKIQATRAAAKLLLNAGASKDHADETGNTFDNLFPDYEKDEEGSQPMAIDEDLP